MKRTGSAAAVLAEDPMRPLNCLGRAGILLDGLQQIIERLHPKGFDGVIVKCSDQHKVWQIFRLLPQFADDSHTIQARHLDVEKHEIGLELPDQIDGLQPVLGGSNYFDFREILEQIGQFFEREFFVIDHDGCDARRACWHEVLV